MDIGEEDVPDPATEFGDLFEGQSVSFENHLEGHDADDVLGSLGHDIAGLVDPSAHDASQHPSEHDILAANLGDFLQQQHIQLHTDTTDYSMAVPGLPGMQVVDSHQNNMVLQDASQQQQQLYLHHHATIDQSGNIIGMTDEQLMSYKYTEATTGLETEIGQDQTTQNVEVEEEQQQQHQEPEVPEPKVKKKVKIVKNVVHFANENIQKYLKRRGFRTVRGEDVGRKTISKGVFALSAHAAIFKSKPKLISFRSRYEPENVVQEIERFWKFYLATKRSQLTQMTAELVPMLIPMMLHFYFEMTLSNLFPIARRICCEFIKKFFHEDKTQENYEILVAITKVTSVDILKSDAILSNLLKKKYEFVLSESTIVHLRNFLSKSTQPTLLSLFTDRFRIQSRESKELFESCDWETMLDSSSDEQDSTDSSDDEVERHFGMDQDPDTDAFQASSNTKNGHSYAEEVINAVRNSATANLPAISIYTLGETPICGAVSQQGSLIAFGLVEAGIRICSPDHARDVRVLENASEPLAPTEFETVGIKSLGGHGGAVYGLQFHPQTKLLYSVGHDSLMRVWDLIPEVPPCRTVYRGHTGPIWNIDMPKSGTMIATAGLDTTARLFIPERNEYVRLMAGHYFSVNTVKFHPNEAYIATGSTDKSVRFWSVNDGNLLRMFTGAAGTVNCVAFHESGKYIAGAGEDRKILIWDIGQGEVIATLDCLANCKDLLFSGNMLAACFRNGTLQIFNLRPIIGEAKGAAELNIKKFPISSPFTSKCFAKTLFKLHYTDRGKLFCLGSDPTKDEEDEAEPTSESQDAQASSTTENIPSNGNNMSMSFEDSSPCPTINTSTGLIPSQMSIPMSDPSAIPDDTSLDADGSMTGSVSTILASRLSQPLSMSSTSGDEVAKEVCPAPAPAPTFRNTSKGTVSLVSSEDLDAAIASVIDQSGGGDHSSDAGGGTITMYAST